MRIAFVGLSGVPYLGRACDIRLANTANVLSKKANVIIINRYSSTRKKQLGGVILNDNIVSYELITRHSSNTIITKFLYIFSIIKEFLFIIYYSKKDKINYLHVYSGHYLDLVFYYLISRITGSKVFYDYVEYRSEKKATNYYHKINNYLFDNHGAKLWDVCTVISDYLYTVANKVNPKLPILKQTPICDFRIFDSNKEDVDIKYGYLMFCGGATPNYFPVIKDLIDSYNSSKIKDSKKLLLVLRGSNVWINKIQTYYPDCIIKTDLPYNQLVALYKNAYGLLIPLKNTISDIARFPNKICEYTAAKGLIISTNYGEIKRYFRDGYNAVIADDSSNEEMTRVLDDLENGKYNNEELRENSYKTGLSYFSIDSYDSSLYNFLIENL